MCCWCWRIRPPESSSRGPAAQPQGDYGVVGEPQASVRIQFRGALKKCIVEFGTNAEKEGVEGRDPVKKRLHKLDGEIDKFSKDP